MTAASPGRPAASLPILLTGLASAALLDGGGDLVLPREMRGTPVEWGGVMGQCVRLASAWRFGLRAHEIDASLPATRLEGAPVPGGWRTRHAFEGIDLVHEVAAVSSVPGVVRTLRASTAAGDPVDLSVTSSFVPVLSPVLVEGIQPHRFEVTTSRDALRVRQREWGLSVRSSRPPDRLLVNRGSWLGGERRGRVEEIGTEYSLRVAPDAPASLSVLVFGGLDRDLDGFDGAAREVIADPAGAARAVAADDRAWTDRTPRLSFPEAPELERGYALARDALRRLYSAPGDGMTGLVAGYPWYSALWCRDLGWMLEALAWLGDLEWMQRSIDTVVRFQCRTSLPILGGEAGELPMQISPGPIFLYGTSDTTLYYPRLMDRWRRHSGAVELPERWPAALGRMLEWAQARADPATGLLRNGGEAEEIAVATGDVARIRYGIDAPDTTIWDSADRRSHAVDVQVLWWEALRAIADLEGSAPSRPGPAACRALADRVAASLRDLYPWPEEQYLYDSLRDGRGVAQIRPNALRATRAGLLPPPLARAIVARAVRDDLTAPWGVRTLSARDPTYDPTAYHEGQVWTIATAWLADAALEVGEPELGVEVLGRIARLLADERAGANECFRGDRPEPYDSCFLLGFSVAPFLATLFEGLWGLRVDARVGELTVRPRFPDGWRSARLERLRVGPGSVDLAWSPGRLAVRWTGPGILRVDAGAAPGTVAAGASTEVAVAPTHMPS